MSDTFQATSVVSRRELLAKVKELQAPRSFATGALGGLTLYLRGHKDKEVLEMLKEGIRFCELCLRDLEAYNPEARYKFIPEKGPKYYSPAEVISDPSNIPGLKQKVKNTRDVLNNILLHKQQVPEQEVKECHDFIAKLLEPYREQAAVSLGEFKYGPTLRK